MDVLKRFEWKNWFHWLEEKVWYKKSIRAIANSVDGYEELYESMFNGEEIAFDLAEGAPSFLFNKNHSVSSNETFIRKVKTSLPKGLRY